MKAIISNTLIALAIIVGLLPIVTHAAAPISITSVTRVGEAVTGGAWHITFSNGVSCNQPRTPYMMADNPHVGPVSNFTEVGMLYTTSYEYTQSNTLRAANAAPMRCA